MIREQRLFGVQTGGAQMKAVDCPCGKTIEGENDDQIVANVQAHIDEDHPDLVGKYSRENILEMAQDR